MPRYYFDILDGNGSIKDEEGADLSDLKAVRREAAYSLADVAQDAHDAANDIKVRVRNEKDVIVLEAEMKFLVKSFN